MLYYIFAWEIRKGPYIYMYAQNDEEGMDALLSKIQSIQKELNRLVNPKTGCCTTPEVLRLSQTLDAYINTYHRMEKRLD